MSYISDKRSSAHLVAERTREQYLFDSNIRRIVAALLSHHHIIVGSLLQL